MFGFKKRRTIKTQNQSCPPVLEALESRTLRSTSAGATIRSDWEVSASTPSSMQGYTPAQILKAHGFDTVGYDAAPGTASAKVTAVLDAVVGTAANTSTAAATATTSATIAVAQPSVDLTAIFAGDSSVDADSDGNGQATIIITNMGNVTAVGELNLALYSSTHTVLDASAVLLNTITNRNVKISPGQSITLRVNFNAPVTAVGGTYDLIGSVTSFDAPSVGNASNDIAVIGNASAGTHPD